VPEVDDEVIDAFGMACANVKPTWRVSLLKVLGLPVKKTLEVAEVDSLMILTTVKNCYISIYTFVEQKYTNVGLCSQSDYMRH